MKKDNNSALYLAIVMFLMFVGVLMFQLRNGVLPMKTFIIALVVLFVAFVVFLIISKWRGK